MKLAHGPAARRFNAVDDQIIRQLELHFEDARPSDRIAQRRMQPNLVLMNLERVIRVLDDQSRLDRLRQHGQSNVRTIELEGRRPVLPQPLGDLGRINPRQSLHRLERQL